MVQDQYNFHLMIEELKILMKICIHVYRVMIVQNIRMESLSFLFADLLRGYCFFRKSK